MSAIVSELKDAAIVVGRQMFSELNGTSLTNSLSCIHIFREILIRVNKKRSGSLSIVIFMP